MTGIRPERQERGGFTLIELLVVMAILATVLTLTATISRDAIELRGATKARIVGGRNAAAFLRQFGADFRQRVERREAVCRVEKREGDDMIVFLTQRQGYAIRDAAADRRVSLVGYRIAGGMLERACSGYRFDTGEERPAEEKGVLSLDQIPEEGPADPPESAYQVIAPAVIRIEFSFLVTQDGKQSILAAPPARQDRIDSVFVTLVTLDPDRRRMLDERKLARIAAVFPDALDGETVVTRWTKTANRLRTELPDIPVQVLQHVRVHDGVFPVPNRSPLP